MIRLPGRGEIFQVRPTRLSCNPSYTPQSYSLSILSVSLFDGSVRMVSTAISARTWGLAVQPNDGEPLPTDWESRLRRDHFAEPWGEAARQLAWSKAGDPERRAKIAAAQKGRPRPANLIEAMLTSDPVLFWPL
jgi:hypothetical protein